MKSHFTASFFTANRRQLQRLMSGQAPIVVSANGLLQRGADSTYAFAQDASFWYLTGIDEPDIVLVIDQDEEYLIVPPRSASREAFDGAVATDVLTKRSGVANVYEEDDGWERLSKRLKKAAHVATLPAAPPYIEQYGMYTNPARAGVVAKLERIKESLEIVDISPHIVKLRMLKQAPELKAIQQAIDSTIDTMQEILKPAALKSYGYEYEVEAELSRGFRRRGAQGHAFEPIVAGGHNACTLHNVANNGKLKAKELLLVDTGAEVEHYAADITRTVSIAAPTVRQKAVHAAVIEVQAFAMRLLKPGVLMREYEQQIEHFMGEQLRALGLIRSINHDDVRKYYPHSTSHFMGLNVHDIGDYNVPLEPGIVMTVEPGIYIPEEGIGVRIEDDVLITKQGIKVLTEKLSRNL